MIRIISFRNGATGSPGITEALILRLGVVSWKAGSARCDHELSADPSAYVVDDLGRGSDAEAELLFN